MEVPFNQRLKKFTNYLIGQGRIKNLSEFADKCGLNRSGVSEKVNGRRALTREFVNSVKVAFPELNTKYLTSTDCEQMLEEQEPGAINVTGHGNQVAGHDLFSSFSPEVRQILSVYEAQLAQATQQIQTLSEQLAKSSEIIANLVKKQ